MFSGIVEEVCPVVSFTLQDDCKRLVVNSQLDHNDTGLGDSICINGVCLTVVDIDISQSGTLLSFDIAEETLRRTSLGRLTDKGEVNLEKSLAVGDKISGHFVFGHVDCTAILVDKKVEGVDTAMTWRVDPDYMRYIAEKGSVSLAGVSLTVGEVGQDTFRVYIIPHTFEKTNLDKIAIGDSVNLEVDMLARYVVNAVSRDKV